MRQIYHLVPRAIWQQAGAGPFQVASLQTEGFIHCSNAEQVAWAANRFYTAETDLLVLGLDVAQLTSPVRDEDPGNGQLFPHIYGPINQEAIASVQQMERAADGRWTFPPSGGRGPELT